jgi:3-oxoacyl-[acyl-carrier-protein] synthase III
VLMPAFGAGLTVCAHLVRWGERVTPLAESDAALPATTKTALQMIQAIRAGKTNVQERSGEGLQRPRFIEQI